MGTPTASRRRFLIVMVVMVAVLALSVGVGPAAASIAGFTAKASAPAAKTGNALAAKAGNALASKTGNALASKTGNALASKTGNRAAAAGKVVVGHSAKNDVAPKLRAITPKKVTVQPKHTLPVLPIPHKHANQKDTAVQSKPAAPTMPATQLNFDGVSFPGGNCFCAPPDPNGEVGSTQYVQMVNEAIQVFDKHTGDSMLGPISIESLWSGFGGVCETDGNGDPIVVYDQIANRWLISEFAGLTTDGIGNVITPPTWECVAVSTSDDATGAYNRYAFDLGTQFGTAFYDYPKLGVWPDAYYMSTNVFTANGSAFLGPQPFALDRSEMLAGQPATIISTGTLTPNDDQLMPADIDGSIQPPAGAPNPFTEVGANPSWKLWRFHVDFTTPANSTFTQAGTLDPDPFTVICNGQAGACVPQAGVPNALDTLGDRSMFRSAYRRFPDGHEALVGNMTVQSNGVAGIRWWEIDNATSGTPSFVQQSTYQPDDTWRWMGSAAMDAAGDMALGFSASSSAIFPQIRYAGRLAGDPPNELAHGEAHLFDGTGSQMQVTRDRWGDYSDLTVDPNDDCTFWYTNEYLQDTSNVWRTRIGNFKFPNCTAGPRGTLAGTVTDASTRNPIAGAEVDTSLGSTTTDSNGHYSITLPVDTYNVTYSQFGYADDTENNIAITDGNTTTINVALTRLPSVHVTGTVTDGSGHGWPLHASIQITGRPGGPVWTDPATGHYSVDLPENATYSLTVTADLPNYKMSTDTLTVGTSDLTHNITVSVDTSTCTTPGYHFVHTPDLNELFDASTIPAGWTVTDNNGSGAVWQINDPLNISNETGGTGNFAVINSQFYGPGNSQDTSLITPSLDLSGQSTPILQFNNSYLGIPGENGDVDVSTDGGQSWTNIWEHTSDSAFGPDLETVPAPQAADKSDVKFRFHFTATSGAWWQVDNVVVENRSCDAIPGGLLVGKVTDANTGTAINGAAVTGSDDPSDTASTAASADPAIGAGYYALFSPAGSHPFTATKSAYQADRQTVNVAADGAARADFSLNAGQLAVSPTSLSTSLVLGKTTSKTLTITNTGTAPASLNLAEQGANFQILTGQGARLRLIHAGEDQTFSPAFSGTSEGGTDEPLVNAGAPTDATWSTIASYPNAIMDNGADIINGKVYSVGGFDGSANVARGNVYDPDTDTWSPIANMPVTRESPGTAAVQGELYVTGGWDSTGTPIAETDVYDPGANRWSTVSANPRPAAAPGVAVADGKIYLVGGCVDSTCTSSTSTQVYDPATDSWTTAAPYPQSVAFASCGGIDGKVYCAGGINGITGATYHNGFVYNPGTDSWSPIASMPIDLWGSAYGAPNGLLVVSGGSTANSTAITNQGFAYDTTTDSWAPVPNAQFPDFRAGGSCGFYKIGGSQTGGLTPTVNSEVLSGLSDCGQANLPWLDENPATTTLQPGQSAAVTVTASATSADEATQPGSYTGQIGIRQDTPYPVSPVDVTMNVTPPKGWGKIAGTVNGTDCNGNPAPLRGAQIQATGKSLTLSLSSDARGSYAFWAPSASNPVTLIASKDGRISQTTKINIKTDKTTTTNFTLRPLHC